jgi:hypothetical protein
MQKWGEGLPWVYIPGFKVGDKIKIILAENLVLVILYIQLYTPTQGFLSSNRFSSGNELSGSLLKTLQSEYRFAIPYEA